MKAKQNRCTEHKQQIVALCVDQKCECEKKAVCPLELYNEHLDHEFENIQKVEKEWRTYETEWKGIEENVSKQGCMGYMDKIIDELLFKIKQHLFLVRKQFEIKLDAYYTSKAVLKIKNALEGARKCFAQRFLDLRHHEIESTKFFVEIYGVKKLLNDTGTQRQNFEKEILIAFAKIKEEMFMDYPKFNALVRAKEYQYCEIIKAQKTQIDVLKQKLSEIAGGFDKVSEQHKQLTYQLMRANNELKNKEALLTDTTEKLKIITKKYNEQAEQAITKAREIKTKNVFGTYASKNLFRVNDRVIRTGDKNYDWPLFADIGVATGKIFIKINRLQVGSWVLIGVMFRHAIEKNEYEFDNYKAIGHGTYMMDSNRWSYSDTDQAFNCKPLGFQFGQNDTIKIQIFETLIRFSKMAYGWEQDHFELPYTRRPDDEMAFCVAIKGEHTEIQLV